MSEKEKHENNEGVKVAEMMVEAGKEFVRFVLSREEGSAPRNGDKEVVQQAMIWHFLFALQFLESLLLLQKGALASVSPAGALFRSLAEIVARGVWIMRPGADHAARARSYLEYAVMKQNEHQRSGRFQQFFFDQNGGRSEETVKAALKEYLKKKPEEGGPMSDGKIRGEIRRKHGKHACTIPFREMLEEIDLEGDYLTVYSWASAATHGTPTMFDTLGGENHLMVDDCISTAGDRLFVLAHRTAAAYGMPEKDFNSLFGFAIQAREKKLGRKS